MATAIELTTTTTTTTTPHDVAAPSSERTTSTAPSAFAPYRVSSEEFLRMIEAEVFNTGHGLFLWDGVIQENMGKSLHHSLGFGRINRLLTRTIPDGWTLWPESPISVSEFQTPLPDFMIVRGDFEDYARAARRPTPSDLGLAIEVAHSSVRIDTGAKLQAYARALIPAYWVVNLVARNVMACGEPRVEGEVGIYGVVKTYHIGESVPLALDGRAVAEIAVLDLLDPELEA